MSTLRIAIRCDFISGGNVGGLEQYVAGLVHSLGQRTGSDVEYVLVTNPRDPDWPAEFMGPNMEIVPRPWASRIERIRGFLGRTERFIKPLVKPFVSTEKTARVKDERTFYESLNVDAVHHPKQDFVETGLPSLYNPHDIQHVFYPEFFTADQLEWRETVYRRGCERATAVKVPSASVKRNLATEYGVDEEKIFVINHASPCDTPVNAPQMDADLEEYGIEGDFVFYPAHLWPHKNHERLLRALAHLRDQHDTDVALVSVGKRTKDEAHWHAIREVVSELDLDERTYFLGYVPRPHVDALYRHSECTVFPSLYEGFGLPILESWHHETPLCCSDISPLSGIAGDASLRFDPKSVEDIAATLDRLLTDARLRKTLVDAGRKRLERFSWEKTAKAHELLYRQIAGQELDEQELTFLNTCAVDVPNEDDPVAC